MSVFRSLVFTSVAVGILVGSAISVVQFAGTSRLIAQAEVYEKGEVAADGHAMSVEEITGHEASGEHHEHRAAWEPADGFERSAYTLAANILTAIGYSLVLTSSFVVRGTPMTWKKGLAWGASGFACVMLAPMLGLPPELPGMPVAPLLERQAWWIGTALATAVAIALVVFHRRPGSMVVALLLVVAPHVIGAPQVEAGHKTMVPPMLEMQFIVTAALTSLLFWILLGGLSGIFFERLSRSD